MAGLDDWGTTFSFGFGPKENVGEKKKATNCTVKPDFKAVMKSLQSHLIIVTGINAPYFNGWMNVK
ncbi:MAG: hypothetical protein HY544_00245 [Candidatus Diapherotrites archaeon]|uniref:Uncharacterized protein n=1 Tax=Candidatus Iainarchaeum sp. TaxID=3101447 RepID=A0A8T3YK17_9ARCH|nr:hypothetical protein [Candidatus Diapherotrites archaeon]